MVLHSLTDLHKQTCGLETSQKYLKTNGHERSQRGWVDSFEVFLREDFAHQNYEVSKLP